MNHSRYLIDERRSPYPVKRRVPKKDIGMRSFEPAITLLPPDPYMMLNAPGIPRPVSPGVYRMLPPKTANNKPSSFVILGETLTTPVQSRPASPSGRVSPFRGHGFKSPTTSRSNSRTTSPAGSPSRTLKKPKAVRPPEAQGKKDGTEKSTRFSHDIGLPPKSPKKMAKLSEFKPASPKRLAPDLNNKVARARQIYSNPIGNVRVKPANTVVINKNLINKKPPVPPKKIGLKPTLKTIPERPRKQMKENEPPKKLVKSADATKPNDPARKEEPKPQEKEATKTPATEVKSEEPKSENVVKTEPETVPQTEAKKTESEKLIPCFQPDKCHIAPPTMASPSPTTSTPSTTSNVTLSSMKNSETKAAAPTTVTASSLSAVSSAVSMSGNLARRRLLEQVKVSPKVEEERTEQAVESVTVKMTTTEEVRVVEHVGSGSATSLKSLAQVPSSARSSAVTVRAASNGSLASDTRIDLPGETISTTKLITAGPDVEVLSPNNLINSPPRRQPNMAWEDDRIPNGDVPSNGERKGRIRRFFAAVYRLLSFLFCCGCSPCCSRSQCCAKLKCCDKIDCKKSKCCRKNENRPQPQPQRESFWSRLNCCRRCKERCKCSNCCTSLCARLTCSKCCKSDCCKKVKCCDGSKCCKKKPKTTSKKCCAKMSCSCKNCCDKVKNCCLDCGEGINSCCRSLFCLNLMCCQKCLRKCRCCHKFKCCQKGGCCSCCNPNVKRDVKKRNNARLDKKTSRTSTQSKSEKEKLDQALVEHTSMMKAAIPVLPTCLAVLCLIINLFLPGGGTLLSGLLCLCFGKPRFSVNDTPQNRIGSFCVNVVIAVAQLFTVIFCLVGWGWSVWWGVIMYKLARKQKRLKLAEKNQQQEGGSSNVNLNHIDVEQG